MKKLLPPRYFRRKARHHNRAPYGWVHSKRTITLEIEWEYDADRTHMLDAWRFYLHAISNRP